MARSLKPPTPERAAAEEAVRLALESRDFKLASRIVASYESKQPVPRGIGIDWSRYDSSRDAMMLATIYSGIPNILRGISTEAVPALRFAAAMQLLWGEFKRRWLSPQPTTDIHLSADVAARMFVFHAYKVRDFTRMRTFPEREIIRAVRVESIPDCCSQCRSLGGKMFSIDAPPELPHPECTSEKGCRCTYTAVLR
jgi:hypothetical protein